MKCFLLTPADTAVPLLPDDATEVTMSSEALPLIFEPFEDVTAKGRAAEATAIARMAAGAQSPVAMATRRQLVTVEADSDGPSQGPSALLPDWTSPWQTSGSELLEPIGSSGPPASHGEAESEAEDRLGKGEGAISRSTNHKDSLVFTWLDVHMLLKICHYRGHDIKHEVFKVQTQPQ